MAQRSGGISGLAILAMAAGGVVLYAGLQNQPILETLRSILKGQPVPYKASESIINKLTGEFADQLKAGLDQSNRVINQNEFNKNNPVTGTPVVVNAEKYLGYPYKFGAAGPNAFDCSGLVNWVVGHDCGFPIPGSQTGRFSGHGPNTMDWYTWSGATTLGGQGVALPGDLVCYPSHMGIYAGNGYMIDAPNSNTPVQHGKVWGQPIYRRLKNTTETIPSNDFRGH